MAYHLSTLRLFGSPKFTHTPPGILQQQVLRTCWECSQTSPKAVIDSSNSIGLTTNYRKTWDAHRNYKGITWNLHGINLINPVKNVQRIEKGVFSSAGPAKIRSEPSASSRMHRSMSISAMARHVREVPTSPSIFTKLNTSPNSGPVWPLSWD